MAWRVLLFGVVLMTICLVMTSAAGTKARLTKQPLTRGRRVLVFGGNGFLGSSTVMRFIMNGDNVTMVNRGNWYWDSFNRIKPYVQHFSCDRKNGVDSCEDLVEFITSVEMFDAVIDFSAYDEQETREAAALLKDKVKLYILISTDSIYDVCAKDHDDLTKETDDQRPENLAEQARLVMVHRYGHGKLRAEEQILKQRSDYDGFPYVILRLPDVIGPRDNTYRWWIYQLWVRLEAQLNFKPITIPDFLKDYHMSLVYSSDVSKLIFELLLMDKSVHDQIFNIAYEQTFTLEEMIRTMQKELGVEHLDIKTTQNHTESLYLFPSVRRGPIDVSKAIAMLDWEPTPFTQAVDEIIKFYEEAMTGDTFNTQKDEVIQTLTHNLYNEHELKLYGAIEEVYGINLQHFKPRDEL